MSTGIFPISILPESLHYLLGSITSNFRNALFKFNPMRRLIMSESGGN